MDHMTEPAMFYVQHTEVNEEDLLQYLQEMRNNDIDVELGNNGRCSSSEEQAVFKTEPIRYDWKQWVQTDMFDALKKALLKNDIETDELGNQLNKNISLSTVEETSNE